MKLIDQVTRLKGQLEAANAEIVDLQKKVKSMETTKEMYYKQCGELKAEIEQVHQFLDAVPNSVARTSNEEQEYARTTRSIVTRLGAWLTQR